MPIRVRAAAAALVLSCVLTAQAQGPAIDHAGVGCIVAERFAGLDARFTPTTSAAPAPTSAQEAPRTGTSST